MVQAETKPVKTEVERPLSELHEVLRKKYQFENPEIFTSRKQALAVIKKLDAKGGVVADVDDEKSDKEHHLTKAQRMKAKLDKQPKVRMLLPLEGKEKRGQAFETVILNGYRTNWPKGEYIEVPQQIADILSESYRQTAEAGKKFRMDRTPEVQKALT